MLSNSSGEAPEVNVPEIEIAESAATTDASAATAEDKQLVKECLAGKEEAWATLIHKYKRLIYSVPYKYGASADDAADIFQGVCLEMFTELKNLRNLESLRSWIITVTVHKMYHWKKRRGATDLELDSLEPEQADGIASVVQPEILEQVQQEQIVREAVAQLPARCMEMVRLLFYQDEPIPYADVARRLGLATGSIGFIRGRCLDRLHKLLEKMGF
jgi:RNA polymerase sigma factor (sigma-70 family)